jgi:molybdate transport system substrate-binding protein
MRITLLTALFLVSSFAAAQSAEVRILTAGAFKPVVTALAPQFEKTTGHTLIIDNDTAGGLTKRIEAGEAFDVVFLPPTAMGTLTSKGFVATEGQANVARVGIGVAVKEGAPVPEIGTTDAFKTALQRAKAIAVIDPKAGGSSGIYLADLFQKWGMTDTLKAKLVLVPGGLVATRLLNDEADLALHQISEIIAVKGAKLVGPLPAEIQNFTVYRAGLAAKSTTRTPAAAFIELMQSPSAKAILQDKGMEPPM